MFAVGILCSGGLGALFPLSMALFADMVDKLVMNFFNAANLIEEQIPLFVYLAVSSLVLGFIQMYFLTLSSKRQARRIRLLFFDVRDISICMLANQKLFKLCFKIF